MQRGFVPLSLCLSLSLVSPLYPSQAVLVSLSCLLSRSFAAQRTLLTGDIVLRLRLRPCVCKNINSEFMNLRL